MKFRPEHFEGVEPETEKRYFGYGVHKVKILGFRIGVTDNGKEYLEAGFTSEDGSLEDTVRVWFTTDASIRYANAMLLGIFTHNAPEGKKAEAKALFKSLQDKELTDMADLLEKKLVGKEMWFTKYTSERTYIDANGHTRNSIDTKIYGYEPTPDYSKIPENMAETAKEVFEKKEDTSKQTTWL